MNAEVVEGWKWDGKLVESAAIPFPQALRSHFRRLYAPISAPSAVEVKSAGLKRPAAISAALLYEPSMAPAYVLRSTDG